MDHITKELEEEEKKNESIDTQFEALIQKLAKDEPSFSTEYSPVTPIEKKKEKK